jgi:hypothetical protein
MPHPFAKQKKQESIAKAKMRIIIHETTTNVFTFPQGLRPQQAPKETVQTTKQMLAKQTIEWWKSIKAEPKSRPKIQCSRPKNQCSRPKKQRRPTQATKNQQIYPE